MADRLQSATRGEDTVSRWGDDEFMCLLPEVKQEADVTRLAETIVEWISEVFTFKGTVLSIKVSIGIAIYPADGETADIHFKHADTAMYKAKGTERRVIFTFGHQVPISPECFPGGWGGLVVDDLDSFEVSSLPLQIRTREYLRVVVIFSKDKIDSKFLW